MTLIELKTQIIAQVIYNIIMFTLILLSLVFRIWSPGNMLFSRIQHTSSECYLNRFFLSFIVLRENKTEVNPNAKQHLSILSFTPVRTSCFS